MTVQIKRGGRHEKEEGKTKPTYEVTDFLALREILERDFGFQLRIAEGQDAVQPSA